MTEDVPHYDAAIDIPSLRHHWPDGREMPALIAEIGAALLGEPWGAVGYIRMSGSRFNDYWIEGGADLWPQFGMFLRLPEGTQIAQWFHAGAVPGAEPIVVIGSEGQTQVIAPNLKTFFRDWAKDSGHFEMTLDEEDRTPKRVALWQAVACKMNAAVDATRDHPSGVLAPDITDFFDKYGTASRAAMTSNPIHREIAQVMAAHIPRGEETYKSYRCPIAVAGQRIELQGELSELETRAMIPLIRKIREERSQGIHAARGLWHSATLKISPDGFVHIPADWEAEPKFQNGPRVTRNEMDADLRRYPRSPRWRMPWMDTLV